MKLLILTQKVDKNDDVLGFFHRWVEEFAKYCEKVTVICLEKGEYNLPENVKVLSLGKDKFKIENLKLKIFIKLKYIFNFIKYIWQERKNYDAIFVHMNPEYVVLGGLFWKIFGKKIGLWYAHGHTPFSLIIAEKLVDCIFTSTKSGCRLNSKKIKIVGQGIDTDKFKIRNPKSEIRNNAEIQNSKINQLLNEKFKIITVGRISPVKDYETLIDAIEILNNEGIKLQVDIVGGIGLAEQQKYFDDLKNLVKEKKLENIVNFVGAIPNNKIIDYLQKADLFVNTSHTGSLDKAILEAMAVQIPVLTCNEALLEVLGEYKNQLMFQKKNYAELAEKIKMVMNMTHDAKKNMGEGLRGIVIKKHSIEGFVEKILDNFYNLK